MNNKTVNYYFNKVAKSQENAEYVFCLHNKIILLLFGQESTDDPSSVPFLVLVAQFDSQQP